MTGSDAPAELCNGMQVSPAKVLSCSGLGLMIDDQMGGKERVV